MDLRKVVVDITAKISGRVTWIDTLRGVMMFIVVWGHSLSDEYLDKYIFSFHMPAFFFISGMTFVFNKETKLLRYISKKLRGLILPYFCLCAIATPLWLLNRTLGTEKYLSLPQLFQGILYSNVASGYRMPSNTLWFITCLFLTDMLFFVISRISKKDTTLILLTGFVYGTAYTAGIITDRSWGVWHWQVAFSAVVFYLGGYIFMKNSDSVKNLLQKPLAAAAIPAALLLLGAWAASQNVRVSLVNNKFGDPILFYFSAFSTTLAATLVIMRLSEFSLFEKCTAMFNYVGKNTLIYIALHVPLIKLSKYLIPELKGKNDAYRFLMAVVIFIVLLPAAWLLERYLPFSVGKKGKPRA